MTAVTLTCANSYLRVLRFAVCREDGVTKLLLFMKNAVCVDFAMLRFVCTTCSFDFLPDSTSLQLFSD